MHSQGQVPQPDPGNKCHKDIRGNKCHRDIRGNKCHRDIRGNKSHSQIRGNKCPVRSRGKEKRAAAGCQPKNADQPQRREAAS